MGSCVLSRLFAVSLGSFTVFSVLSCWWLAAGYVLGYLLAIDRSSAAYLCIFPSFDGLGCHYFLFSATGFRELNIGATSYHDQRGFRLQPPFERNTTLSVCALSREPFNWKLIGRICK